MLAEKIPESALTDYQREKLSELRGHGGNYGGSVDGMPLMVVPNQGAFVISPRRPEGARSHKEFLRVTRIDPFAAIAD
jgi:hypothetical protein